MRREQLGPLVRGQRGAVRVSALVELGDQRQAGPAPDLRGEELADAESWVGEFYADLAELGVDAVTLLEADRTVYGPMSLHPSG